MGKLPKNSGRKSRARAGAGRSGAPGRARAVNNALLADITLLLGATGSGKSSAIVCRLAASNKVPRLIIYDPGEDFGQFGRVFTSIKALRAEVVAAGAGPFSLVYRPSDDLAIAREQFNALCRIAFDAGNLLFVADELEDVTLPNWAPPGWRALVRKGRKRGIPLIAASQLPAGIEKRIWEQATCIRSGRLNGEDGARTVSKVLMVSPLEIVSLPPLSWIQRSVTRRAIERGHIEYRRNVPFDVLDSQKKIEFPQAV